MDKLSERRLAENEVIFRQVNEDVKEFVLENASDKKWENKKLRFYCECSNMDCRSRIQITAKEYDAVHSNKKRFIIRPGHDIPEIEKIINNKVTYVVIEKYKLPPVPQKIEGKHFA